jgi:phage-related protein
MLNDGAPAEENRCEGPQFHGKLPEGSLPIPKDARRQAGYQLDRVQNGLEPEDFKPMSDVGSGVQEIRIKDEAGIFRVLYVAKLEDAVDVLHCFQKKTQRTAKSDLDLASKRYSELVKEQKRSAIRHSRACGMRSKTIPPRLRT